MIRKVCWQYVRPCTGFSLLNVLEKRGHVRSKTRARSGLNVTVFFCRFGDTWGHLYYMTLYFSLEVL